MRRRTSGSAPEKRARYGRLRMLSHEVRREVAANHGPGVGSRRHLIHLIRLERPDERQPR